MNNKIIKLIAITTAFVLLTNTIVWAVPGGRSIFPRVNKSTFSSSNLSSLPRSEAARGATSHLPPDIYIPGQYGSINKPQVTSHKPKVILIKDAHCVYEAQENIERILDILIRDYKIDLVCVEGASGLVDTSVFQSMPDKKARERASDKFVKKGLLTASEALSISRAGELPFTIWGVEDTKLYVEDFKLFRETIKGGDEALRFIKIARALADKLKGKIYNPELREFEDTLEQYKWNSLGITEWIKFLEKLNIEKGLQITEFLNFNLVLNAIELEEDIDFGLVEKERAGLIKELEKSLPKEDLRELIEKSLLFKLGKVSPLTYYTYLEQYTDQFNEFSYLNKYIHLIGLHSRIDEDTLFKELDEIESAIARCLFKTHIEEILYFTYRKMDILDKILHLRMSRDELEYYSKHRAEFFIEDISNFLIIQAGSQGIVVPQELKEDKFLSKIQEHMRPAEEFYKLALRRDEVFVGNLIKKMEKERKDKAVIVAGGFHAEGLKEKLQEQDIECIEITPAITKIQKENPYLELMMDEDLNIEALLPGNIGWALLFGQGAENLKKYRKALKEFAGFMLKGHKVDELKEAIRREGNTEKEELFNKLVSLIDDGIDAIVDFVEGLPDEKIEKMEKEDLEVIVDYILVTLKLSFENEEDYYSSLKSLCESSKIHKMIREILKEKLKAEEGEKIDNVRQLFEKINIDFDTWVKEQLERMSVWERRDIRQALVAIGLTEEQIEMLIDRILLFRVISDEKAKSMISEIGGLVIRTSKGIKVLFPKDYLVYYFQDREYLADLLEEIVALQMIDQGIGEDKAPGEAMKVKARFLGGHIDIGKEFDSIMGEAVERCRRFDEIVTPGAREALESIRIKEVFLIDIAPHDGKVYVVKSDIDDSYIVFVDQFGKVLQIAVHQGPLNLFGYQDMEGFDKGKKYHILPKKIVPLFENVFLPIFEKAKKGEITIEDRREEYGSERVTDKRKGKLFLPLLNIFYNMPELKSDFINNAIIRNLIKRLGPKPILAFGGDVRMITHKRNRNAGAISFGGHTSYDLHSHRTMDSFPLHHLEEVAHEFSHELYNIIDEDAKIRLKEYFLNSRTSLGRIIRLNPAYYNITDNILVSEMIAFIIGSLTYSMVEVIIQDSRLAVHREAIKAGDIDILIELGFLPEEFTFLPKEIERFQKKVGNIDLEYLARVYPQAQIKYEEEKKRSSAKSQIGKQHEVLDVRMQLEQNRLLVTVRNIETGQIEEFPLNISSSESLGDKDVKKAVKTAGIKYKKLIQETLNLFHIDKDIHLCVFTNLIGDLFGFASTDSGLIAIHESLAENPIALFHEIGHYLIEIKNLKLKMKNKNTLAIYIDGVEHTIKLNEEALTIARKGRKDPHYLLRALQRQVFGEEDRELTAFIKGKQLVERLFGRYDLSTDIKQDAVSAAQLLYTVGHLSQEQIETLYRRILIKVSKSEFRDVFSSLKEFVQAVRDEKLDMAALNSSLLVSVVDFASDAAHYAIHALLLLARAKIVGEDTLEQIESLFLIVGWNANLNLSSRWDALVSLIKENVIEKDNLKETERLFTEVLDASIDNEIDSYTVLLILTESGIINRNNLNETIDFYRDLRYEVSTDEMPKIYELIAEFINGLRAKDIAVCKKALSVSLLLKLIGNSKRDMPSALRSLKDLVVEEYGWVKSNEDEILGLFISIAENTTKDFTEFAYNELGELVHIIQKDSLYSELIDINFLIDITSAAKEKTFLAYETLRKLLEHNLVLKNNTIQIKNIFNMLARIDDHDAYRALGILAEHRVFTIDNLEDIEVLFEEVEGIGKYNRFGVLAKLVKLKLVTKDNLDDIYLLLQTIAQSSGDSLMPYMSLTKLLETAEKYKSPFFDEILYLPMFTEISKSKYYMDTFHEVRELAEKAAEDEEKAPFWRNIVNRKLLMKIVNCGGEYVKGSLRALRELAVIINGRTYESIVLDFIHQMPEAAGTDTGVIYKVLTLWLNMRDKVTEEIVKDEMDFLKSIMEDEHNRDLLFAYYVDLLHTGKDDDEIKAEINQLRGEKNSFNEVLLYMSDVGKKYYRKNKNEVCKDIFEEGDIVNEDLIVFLSSRVLFLMNYLSLESGQKTNRLFEGEEVLKKELQKVITYSRIDHYYNNANSDFLYGYPLIKNEELFALAFFIAHEITHSILNSLGYYSDTPSRRAIHEFLSDLGGLSMLAYLGCTDEEINKVQEKVLKYQQELKEFMMGKEKREEHRWARAQLQVIIDGFREINKGRQKKIDLNDYWKDLFRIGVDLILNNKIVRFEKLGENIFNQFYRELGEKGFKGQTDLAVTVHSADSFEEIQERIAAFGPDEEQKEDKSEVAEGTPEIFIFSDALREKFVNLKLIGKIYKHITIKRLQYKKTGDKADTVELELRGYNIKTKKYDSMLLILHPLFFKDKIVNAIYSAVDKSKEENAAIVNTFIAAFSKENIPIFRYSELYEDLFGFANYNKNKRGYNFISLHESLAENPIALFHEIGHYLIKIKNLELKMKNENTLAIYIDGVEHTIKLNEEASAIARKDSKDPHYLLRALQRQVFGRYDKDLTTVIKAEQLLRDLEDTKSFKGLDGKGRDELKCRILEILYKVKKGREIAEDDLREVVLIAKDISLDDKFELVARIAKFVNSTCPNSKRKGEIVLAIEGEILRVIRKEGYMKDELTEEMSLLETVKKIGEKKGIPPHEIQSIFDLFRDGIDILVMDPYLDMGQIDASYFTLIEQISELTGISEGLIRKAFSMELLGGRRFEIPDGVNIPADTKLSKAAKKLEIYNEMYKDTQGLLEPVPDEIKEKSKGTVVVFNVEMFKYMPLVGFRTVLNSIKTGDDVELGLRVPSGWDRKKVLEWIDNDWELRDNVILLDEDIAKAKEDPRLKSKDIVFVEDEEYKVPQGLERTRIFGVSRDAPFYQAFLLGIVYARMDEVSEFKGFLRAQNIPIEEMQNGLFFVIKIKCIEDLLEEFEYRRIYFDIAA